MTDLKKYIPIAEAVSRLLHPFAEVVLHDVEKNQIVEIFNNFTQRKPGDSSYIDNIEGFENGPEFHGPFIRNNFFGHHVKYTTCALRNDNGKAIGLLCINIKIDYFRDLQNVINLFFETKKDSADLDELFNDDWQDRISAFVQKFRQERNMPFSKLTRQERMELVHSLHEAGAFRAANAATYTAKVLGVSRATIYNYLSRLEANKA